CNSWFTVRILQTTTRAECNVSRCRQPRIVILGRLLPTSEDDLEVMIRLASRHMDPAGNADGEETISKESTGTGRVGRPAAGRARAARKAPPSHRGSRSGGAQGFEARRLSTSGQSILLKSSTQLIRSR